MGLVGKLELMNSYRKRQCRRLFWRIRAAMKEAMKNNRSDNPKLKFQYDPSSYALNFDDGCGYLSDELLLAKLQAILGEKNVAVYVLWVNKPMSKCPL